MTEFDPAVAGKSLGLAIHYLEDLTQPMHSGLFINVPGSPHPGMRHEAYERWMFSQQDRCLLAVSELKLDEFQDFDFRRYFEHAAWQSLAEFEKWVGVATSPIGVFSDFSRPQNWLPVASRMLKLAQRLVAGLLLSWRPAERWS